MSATPPNSAGQTEQEEARLRVQEKNGVVTIEILSRVLTGQSDIERYSKALSRIVEPISRPKVVLDVAHIEAISSRMLGEIIAIGKKVQQRSGQLRLANMTPQVREVFAVTRLDQRLVVCDNVAAAIRSFD